MCYNKSMKNLKIFSAKVSLAAACAALTLFPAFPALEFHAEAQTEKKSVQNFYNNVILLSFHDEPQFASNFSADLQLIYDGDGISVKNYFSKQSNGKVSVNTLLAGGGEIIYSKHPENYYKPAYEWINGHFGSGRYEQINPEGYDNRYYDESGNAVSPSDENAKPSCERICREQLLVREAAEAFTKKESGALTDGNTDGIADSFVIITDAGEQNVDWGDLLWSHKSSCLPQNKIIESGAYYWTEENKTEYGDFGYATLGSSYLFTYNVISENDVLSSGKNGVTVNDKKYNAGVLCHELAHNMGLPDYYPYYSTQNQPVGELDLMGTTLASPQYSLAYVREKAGWLSYSDFGYVSRDGEYELYPVASGNGDVAAYKLILSDYYERGEYFMLEARGGSSNDFDGKLSSNGLVIYRVNEKAAFTSPSGETGTYDYGDMYGDEVYVYRLFNGKKTDSLCYFGTASGENESMLGIDLSAFGNADKTLNYSKLSTIPGISGDKPVTALYYSDGSNSGVVISQIKKHADGKISFTAKLPEPDGAFPILTEKSVSVTKFYDGSNRLKWNLSAKTGKVYVLALRSTDRLKQSAEKGEITITLSDAKSGGHRGYVTEYSATVPLAEKKLALPDFYNDVLIFFAVETENGNFCSRYAGAIAGKNSDSLGGFLYRTFDPLYLVIAGATILVIAIGAISAVIGIKYLKKSRRKNYSDKK